MNRRSPFLGIFATFFTFILLMGASISLVLSDGIIQKYRTMASLRGVKSLFWKQGEKVKYYFSLKDQNNKLLEENTLLLSRIDYRESADSSGIVKIEETSAFRFIPAKILSNSTNKLHNYIVLDKGKKDGIKEDMGVITPNGVVGYVSSVSDKYSLVVSFLDINYSVSAIIKSSNTFGPLRWEGKRAKRATLCEIPLHTEINAGDTIVTSGFSTIYPPGIPLGTIDSYKLIDGINYNVSIDLFEDYNSLKFVYVVVNNDQDELQQLILKRE